MGVIVGIDWLQERLRDDEVVPIDVRAPYFYQQGHIPGAVNLPATMLVSPTGELVPSEPLAGHLGRLGIASNNYLVTYDDGAGPVAAHVYFILTCRAHSRVSILDGGIAAWRNAGYEVEQEEVLRGQTKHEVAPADSTCLARLADVREAIPRDEVVIVDARSANEYRGMQASAMRNGHIPGALNVEWTRNFKQEAGALRLLSREELRSAYEQRGITPDKLVIVHCNTGSRSSETYAVLKELGYSNVANYVAGWQEWGNRDDTPVEQD